MYHITYQVRRWQIIGLALLSFIIATPTQASVYGALYEVGNLTADTLNGSNTEAVLTYVAGEDGFIAITANADGESEWWTSDKFGITWTRSTVNPLDDYDCTQVGRHGIHTYDGSVYFGANCAAGPTVFEVTGLDSVEHEHTYANESGLASNYPAATELVGSLYMFFNGGYSVYDGTTWTDVTDATNQPNDAPLEASHQVNDTVYLAFHGSVLSFDGSDYEVIGSEYLEEITDDSTNSHNLPAIEYYNDTIYVGNQNFTDGARIFKRDPTDTTSATNVWDVVTTLDADNTIINKMLLSSSYGGDRYLVYFTANGTEGVNMFAMDESETMTELVDAGLGGTDPENNVEVISAIRRTITDRGTPRDVMVFSTKNETDQTKIFVLALGKSFAFTPLGLSSTPSSVTKKTDTLREGRRYRVVVPASKVKAGDKYTLYIDGEAVDTITAKTKRSLTLRYKDSQLLSANDAFTVQVGRQLSYGHGTNQMISRNVVKGAEVTVTIQ